MAIQLLAGNTDCLKSRNSLFSTYAKIVVIAMLVTPCIAFADNLACTDMFTSMNTVKTVLSAISVVVVTIAVIFAGYQISFAHKRISEVAPVLIGSVLIGGAASIATMFITAVPC